MNRTHSRRDCSRFGVINPHNRLIMSISNETSCLECGHQIPTKRLSWKTTKFCSNRCRQIAYNKNTTQRSAYKHLSPGTVGALHELTVACDLIRRGFHVFRAISASCVCDLAILKGKKLVRVEVTTGYHTVAGNITYPLHDPSNYDIMAVVVKGGITYFPPGILDNI